MTTVILVSLFTLLGATLAASGASAIATATAVMAFMGIGIPVALIANGTDRPSGPAPFRRRATR